MTVFVLNAWLLSPDPIDVTVVRVETGLVEETITNSRAGTVKARQRAHLSSEVGGRVVSVPYNKGDHVQKGDLLLRLNDAAEASNLEMAQRELVVSQANRTRSCLEASRAQREYARFQDLSHKELVSTDELDKVHSMAQASAAACQAADASVERARTRIQEAHAQLQKMALYAPFSGILADVKVEVGEWTTPAPPGVPIPAVLDLIDPTSIYISAPMDEVDSSTIHPELVARITLDPYPKQSFMGRVVRVAPYVEDIEEQNRTVEIDVELDDREFATTLLPGTSADVEIILSQKERVLRIPRTAVLEGDKVWTVEQNTITERSIQMGLKNWDYVEIQEGLAEGDLVITSLDQADLHVGLPARITENDHVR
ncbi:MAG: RND transporter [Nitrospirales bacterium]|nr:MAG: RND transporter [Nitrospirales bacterium]